MNLLKLTTSKWSLYLVLVVFLSFAIPNIALAAEEEASGGFIGALDSVFSALVAVLDKVLFLDIST